MLKKIIVTLSATLIVVGVASPASARPTPDSDHPVCERHERLVGATCFPQGLPRVDTRTGSKKGAEGRF